MGVSDGEGVTVIGVPFGSKIVSGVSVGGARVGMGACVGVACRVLPGKARVGGMVGGAKVGRGDKVGMANTTVAAAGVVTNSGRVK